MGAGNHMVGWGRSLVFLIAGLIVGLLTYHGCGPVKEHYTVHTDTIPGDSVPYVVYHDKPVPYAVYIWNTDSIPYPIFDTVEIITDHFTTNYYGDTLKDDTSAFIAYSATVFRNEIQDFKLDFQNKRATIINNYYPANKNKIHLGAIGTLNGVSFEAGYSYGKNQFGLLYGTQGLGFGYRRTFFEW